MVKNGNCNVTKKQDPILFGVMCNGYVFPGWQARCLENLLALDFVQVALLIIDDNGNFQKLSNKICETYFNKLFFMLYAKFFLKPAAYLPVDMSSVLSRVPTIRCKTIKKGIFSEYFNEDDVQKIRGYGLDFILRFAFNHIRGEILRASRYGVWSFHHDEAAKYRGGPACFWEIYRGDSITGAILQKLTERLDSGIVLKKGFFKTITHSYGRNIDTVYFESAKWPAQVCNRIRNGNVDYRSAPPVQTKERIFCAPNNLQMLLFFLKLTRSYISRIYESLFRHEEWNIGIVYEPIHVFLKPSTKPKVHWFTRLKRGKSRADPFGTVESQRVHILFEDFDYRALKGVISCIESTDRSFFSQPKVMFDLPTHMAYPYLLQYRGEIYCIPETYHARQISLYRVEFPDRWTKVATLLNNIAAIDSTVFQYGGHWWLMFTDYESNPNLNLFIWYAPDLLGPWKPHAANPVKTDIRSARPAGTPFLHDGCLYRPAQDCSRTYGRRVIINRVIRLTPTEFKEEPEAVVEPFTNGPYPDGVHTISALANITLVDGKRIVFVGSAFKHALVRGFNMIFSFHFKNSSINNSQ